MMFKSSCLLSLPGTFMPIGRFSADRYLRRKHCRFTHHHHSAFAKLDRQSLRLSADRHAFRGRPDWARRSHVSANFKNDCTFRRLSVPGQ